MKVAQSQLNTWFWQHENWPICSMTWVHCLMSGCQGSITLWTRNTVHGPEPIPGPQGLSSNVIKYNSDYFHTLVHKWLPMSSSKSLMWHLRTFTFRPHPSSQAPCFITPFYKCEALIQGFLVWLQGKGHGLRCKIIHSGSSSVKTSDYLKLSHFLNISVSSGTYSGLIGCYVLDA